MTEKVVAAIGLGMWNRSKVKNFYPRGIENDLSYYSTQFNSVELNATFSSFTIRDVAEWKENSAPHFTFVPKIPGEISHVQRLSDIVSLSDQFVSLILNLDEKLGPVFLQCPDDFGPSEFERLRNFVDNWNLYHLPLAVEVRHAEWHQEPFASEYYQFLEENDVANILIDTVGRRDLMHMRMTTQTPYIRWVGCNNDEIDLKRLDEWAVRFSEWQQQGMRSAGFFLHQNEERDSAKLAAHFIRKLNELGVTDLEPPTIFNQPAPSLEP